MFNLSKQSRRNALLLLMLAMTPVLIDACGATTPKSKNNFEIVPLAGISLMVVLGARRRRPSASQSTPQLQSA